MTALSDTAGLAKRLRAEKPSTQFNSAGELENFRCAPSDLELHAADRLEALQAEVERQRDFICALTTEGRKPTDAEVEAAADEAVRIMPLIEAERLSAPSPTGSVACTDCGRAYGDEFGFPDLVVPDQVWSQIAPHGAILCPSCLCQRAAKLGIHNITAEFKSGPFCKPSPAVTEEELARVIYECDGLDGSWEYAPDDAKERSRYEARAVLAHLSATAGAETVEVEREACAKMADAVAVAARWWRSNIEDYNSHEATSACTQRDTAEGLAAAIRSRASASSPVASQKEGSPADDH